VGLPVPGGRPAWPGHRRPALDHTRPDSCPALLHPRAAGRRDPGRGHHRPRPRLPQSARRADPLGPAHRRAVRQQSGRGRSRTAQSPLPDARAEAAPVSADPGRRSRLRAEPAPGPLRHRHRRPSSPQRSSGRTPRACTAQPREPAVGTGSGPHGRAADGQGGYFSTRSPTRGLDVLDCAAADGAVRLDDRGSAGGCRVGGSTNTRPMASGCGSSWISTRTRVFRA